jgi:hypothetical protein
MMLLAREGILLEGKTQKYNLTNHGPIKGKIQICKNQLIIGLEALDCKKKGQWADNFLNKNFDRLVEWFQCRPSA